MKEEKKVWAHIIYGLLHYFQLLFFKPKSNIKYQIPPKNTKYAWKLEVAVLKNNYIWENCIKSLNK